MPTGPKHMKFLEDGTEENCRCTIGDDHNDPPEYLSSQDAEDIYRSSGNDEDYDFRR